MSGAAFQVLDGLEALRLSPSLFLPKIDPHLMLVPVLRAAIAPCQSAEIWLHSKRKVSLHFDRAPYVKNGEDLTRRVTTLGVPPDGLFVACAFTEALVVTMGGFTQTFAMGKTVTEIQPAPAEVTRIDLTIDSEIFGVQRWELARLTELVDAFSKVFPETKLKLTEL